MHIILLSYCYHRHYLHTSDVFLEGLLQRWHWQLHQLVLILMHLPYLVPVSPCRGKVWELHPGPVVLLSGCLLRHEGDKRPGCERSCKPLKRYELQFTASTSTCMYSFYAWDWRLHNICTVVHADTLLLAPFSKLDLPFWDIWRNFLAWLFLQAPKVTLGVQSS